MGGGGPPGAVVAPPPPPMNFFFLLLNGKTLVGTYVSFIIMTIEYDVEYTVLCDNGDSE